MINTNAVIIIGAIILFYGAYKMSQPQGIRLNNPGNLREGENGGIKWQGESDIELSSEFEEFKTPEDGIRALVRVLLTYRDQYGLTTISEIISRWSPPVENDTDSYIRSVSSFTGIDPDETINYSADLNKLVRAIIYHENGVMPYKMSTINAGIARALV